MKKKIKKQKTKNIKTVILTFENVSGLFTLTICTSLAYRLMACGVNYKYCSDDSACSKSHHL